MKSEMMNQLVPNTFPLISVVMPVFNEEATVESVLLETITALQEASLTFEIIAVEDGSKDRSFEILRNVQYNKPGLLTIVRHIYNKGYGASLRTGIRCARGEIVVCMDADGQHTAQDILKLLAEIPPYDLVVGYRTENYLGSWHRNLGNRFYNIFASWLANFKILDLTSGFRAMRREAVSHFLPLYPAGFSASLTVTMAFLKAGYNVTFVPVDVRQRTGGKSKVRLWEDGGRFFSLILRIVMLYDPMRIFTPVSILASILGLASMALSILDERRFFFPNSTILFFFAAIFIFLLGLVASQIVNSRIYYFGDETLTVFKGSQPETDLSSGTRSQDETS